MRMRLTFMCLHASLRYFIVSSAHEEIQVDARVWNSEGYFEYPDQAPSNEVQQPAVIYSHPPLQQQSHSQAQLYSQAPAAHQLPPPPPQRTPPTPNPQYAPAPPLLLPNMFSAPSNTSQNSQAVVSNTPHGISQMDQTAASAQAGAMLLAMIGGGSSEAQSVQTSSIDSQRVEQIPSRTKKTAKKSQQKSTQQKQPEKWAWSAFQNSPDPSSLPMPPCFSPRESPANSPVRGLSGRDAFPEEPKSNDAMAADLKSMLNIS